MATRPIHGNDFLEWLRLGGIIPEQTRRVVIDASVSGATKIYVESFASRDMITVDVPAELRVAKVETVR